MRVETFDYLWEQGIAKAAKDVIDEILQSVGTTYEVKLDLSAEKRKEVYNQYDCLRKEVRKKFFNTGDMDENKIDGHKICACIAGALLKERLVSFETKENIPVEILRSNYSIAFLASVYVMYLFLLSDYEREGQMDLCHKLEKKATFEFPPTRPGHDNYVLGRIKTLALNDAWELEFDVLAYADMLFWIEKHNKDLLVAEGEE